MVNWEEVWAELLKTAEEVGVARYTIGERLFGKDGLKRIYQKKVRACRCLCEDLIAVINDEIKSKKLLKDKDADVKKATQKKLKSAEKKVSSNKPTSIPQKETTVDAIQAAIDLIKAQQRAPLIVEQSPKEETVVEINPETVEEPIEEQKEVPIEKDVKEPTETLVEDEVSDIAVFNADEEEPLFVRVDKMSFILDDYFYRMQYPFKIISGREEVDEGDHILLFIKTNGEVKPYILSADQFKEFVSTGKVNHWFSVRLPKEIWEKMSKVETPSIQEEF